MTLDGGLGDEGDDAPSGRRFRLVNKKGEVLAEFHESDVMADDVSVFERHEQDCDRLAREVAMRCKGLPSAEQFKLWMDASRIASGIFWTVEFGEWGGANADHIATS